MTVSVIKTELRLVGEPQVFRIRKNSRILSVGMKYGLFYIWWEVSGNSNTPKETRKFEFFVDGVEYQREKNQYIGTFFLENNSVYHLYEILE